MEDKHESIEPQIWLFEDFDAPVERLVYAMSYLLTRAHIAHQCRRGSFWNSKTGDVIVWHCWIELDNGGFISIVPWCQAHYTGDEWPNGLFRFAEQSEIVRIGIPMDQESLSDDEFDEITGGIFRSSLGMI